MIKKFAAFFVLTVVLVGSPLAVSQSEGELRIALRSADYDSLDPHVSSFAQASYVFQNVFDRLVYLDGDGNYNPWLATSWEPNDDATEWTLRLRSDVVFHDGTPFDAAAVQFNFDRMTDPGTLSRQAGPLLGSYAGSVVVDPQTLVVSFGTTTALLPFILSSPFMGIVSPAAVEAYGADFADHLVGSGPFTFVSEIRGNQVILERNPVYNWAPAVFHEGAAYLERIVFRFVVESEPRLATLETGESHLVDEVPPTQVERLQNDPRFNVVAFHRPGIANSLFLNMDLEPMNDILVRRAMMHAINREALDQAVFRGIYPLATQILAPPTLFYDESLDDQYPYDPARAIALLEEAGWTEIGRDGIRRKDGKVLSLFHATYEGFIAEAPAEIIQAQLREVGIEFDVNVMSGTAMMSGMASLQSTFNTALVATGSPDPGQILHRFFHSRSLGSQNFSHYSNPVVDRLLERGLETADAEARSEIYSEISRILLEDVVAIPLFVSAVVFGVSDEVSGLFVGPHGRPQLFDVRIGD